mgnify:CR=1 FL=1
MAKTGKNYITQTGLPVKVIAINSDNMLLQSLVTDNRLCVPLNYPLSPFNRKKPISELKDKPYILPSERIKSKNLNKKPLSAIIDKLLLPGKRYTMKGLIREIKRRASSQCKDKDIAANIRARIYWLEKRNKLM